MPITVLLELKVNPESVPTARVVMGRALEDTRNFDGNLGVDFLVDADDQAHWIIYQRWETVAHDDAYQAFRAGEGEISGFGQLLAEPPTKTRYTTADS